jgi:hypothetical protein
MPLSAMILRKWGAFVEQNFPTFLTLPGPPGFAHAKVFLNDATKDAVSRRDRDAVMDVIRSAREAAA